ncbi:MAG: molybdopterin-dependent oxidoreductase [Hyphomicrobiaceae bacterium]
MPTTTRTPAFCTQCRSRCGCVAVVEDGRLTGIEPLPGHPTGDKLCPKGRAAPELVYHADRLTRPLRRTKPKGAADPGWQPVSWDEALDEIARRLADISATHGPEQVAFSATTPSGTHISDGIAWIERLVRAYGSPNSIYATEICNWHKDYATRFTFGTDIGTPDFAHTDCVLLWGNNPAATWLARATEVQKAVKRGARMIVVDPRPTAFAKRAHQWLRVTPGTDQALALGLANLLIAKDAIDHAFLTRWTNGPLLVRGDTGRFLRESDLTPGGSPDVLFARAKGTGTLIAYDSARGAWREAGAEPELRGQAQVIIGGTPVACRTAFDIYASAAAEYPPSRVAHISGVTPEALQSAADILAASSSVAYFCWNGVGQSVTATQTDRAITLLYALTGSYGRRGGNVPGTAAVFGDISGLDLLTPEQRAKALGLKERPLGPGLSGSWVTARDVYRAILDRTPYPVRALVSFGTNLLASQPDTATAEAALKALEFHVHADFFANATARYADIVLPVATSWEREGLRTGFDVNLDGLRRVQLRPAVIAPIGEARSDTDIVLGLARRLNLENTFFGGDTDRGHDSVLAPAGLSVAALRANPDGVVLDTSVPLEAYATPQADGTARGFATPTRRVEIYSERLLQHGYPPIPTLADAPGTNGLGQGASTEFPLRLSSAKLVAFCHSQHRNIGSLRRLVPDPLLEIAPAAASARGVKEGDWLRITTAAGSVVARAHITPGLADDTVSGQHGWWVEGPAGSPYDARHPLAANINRVISTHASDPVSGSIPLRASWCNVEKLEPSAPYAAVTR